MSLVRFLTGAVDTSAYDHVAKGILYVIYDVLWKIMYAIGSLVDVITGLFYKLAGLDYLGSGSETLVEEQDLLSQLFNQNIVSGFSLFMIIAALLLTSVFGVAAVVREMYFSKTENRKVMVDVIKNMVLGAIFLMCLTPITMFAISSISTLTPLIAGIFGDTSETSIADLMFNISFSGDAIAAYNEIYTADITSWTQIEGNFLFDLAYGGHSVDITFYWYVYFLGGGVILFNLVMLALGLIKRVFNIIVLYLTAPLYVARMVDDGGAKFKEWKNKALGELVSILGTVMVFMLVLSFMGVINDLELVNATAKPVVDEVLGTVTEGEVNPTALLLNNLTKMFLLMAGIVVAKDSGKAVADIFKSANDGKEGLLEGIYNRLGPKEGATAKSGSANAAPRTRVITKNTTSTKKVINFTESIPQSSTGEARGVNVTNHQNNTYNTSMSHVDKRVTNIQNRANLMMSEGGNGESGVKSGGYRNVSSVESGINSAPTDMLTQDFIKNYKREANELRGEWNFLKATNSEQSKEVIRDFEAASRDLSASIATGEQSKIKNSMNQYVNAYKKEEKVAKEGYKDFATKSAKLNSDLSAQQQQELKKISAAYRKAQVDYGKTARKLTEVSRGNMSTSDALRLKENADKQRAKLMEASARATNFYNNQKRG